MKTALIVDDDSSIRGKFSRLLQENGYEVCAVPSGKEAIEKASESHFDLLLLDYVLNDIDGLTALEKMGDTVRDTVIIMLTGFPTLQETTRAFDLGVDAYLEKPIDPQDLLSLIEQKIARRKQKDENNVRQTS